MHASFINIIGKIRNTLKRLAPFTAVATLLLIIWAVLAFNDTFCSDRSFAVFSDNESFLGPVLSWISRAIQNGEIPLRTSSALGGLPLYNLAQLSFLYPFYFTIFDLFYEPIICMRSMHIIVLIHIFIFGVNSYILMRSGNISRPASVIGAALVALCANSADYSMWINTIAAYSWVPLYLAGVTRILNGASPRVWIPVAVAALVFLTLASPAQPLIHAVFLTTILSIVWWWWNGGRLQSRIKANHLLRLALAALVAALLAAPGYVPMMLEYPQMTRWLADFPPIQGYTRIPFEAFLCDQVSLRDAGGVLVPAKGPAVGSMFLGPVIVFFALFAVFSRTKSSKWMTIAMFIICVYSLLSSFGANLGLAYINYYIPLVNKIREPSRFLILFQLAATYLAAVGLDTLVRDIKLCKMRKEPDGRFACKVMLLATSTVALTFLSVLTLRSGKLNLLNQVGSNLMLMALAFFSISSQAKKVPVCIIQILWGAAALVVVIISINWTPPLISSSLYVQKDFVSLKEAISRIAERDKDRFYRVIFEGEVDKQKAAMLASFYNMRTLNAYFNPAPTRQFEELYHHEPRNDNYLQALGSRYLVTKKYSGTVDKGFNHIEKVGEYDLYETENVSPYVSFVNRSDGHYSSLADFVSKLAGKDLAHGILFFPGRGDSKVSDMQTSSPESIVVIEKRRNNYIRLDVSNPQPGVLVINEFFAKPWFVRVNGSSAKLLEVNGNQIGVQLKEGVHIVEFNYWPTALTWSFYASAAGFLVLIGILTVKLRL